MTFESILLDPADIESANERASMLMKEGIRLLEASDANAAVALQCFDHALEIRRRLPLDVPGYSYALAACWLNRADAFTRLGKVDHHALALHAYDAAIALLSRLPLAEDARFAKRLALAQQNRGLLLQAQQPPATDDATRAFAEAIAVLECEHAKALPDRPYLLAVVSMNLANAHSSKMTSDGDAMARDAARRAITFVGRMEEHDVHAAEAGLKARHVLCQTIARRLSPAMDADPETILEEVHAATDMVDDGLRLIRHWEVRRVFRFRALAADLFRFGARVYARYQPHFLDEFMRENSNLRER